MTPENLHVNIEAYVERRRARLIELTRDLVRIPSENKAPNGCERGCQEYVGRVLRAAGWQPEVYELSEVAGLTEHPLYMAGREYAGRPNLGARLLGNGGGLLARLRAEAGITFTLVTGDQEAALTYWGATSGLEDGGARRAVLDLGGGSLEIVVGEGSDVQWRVSLPLGSGAMHDRLAPSDPAQTEELAAVRAETARTLATLAPPLPVHVALVAGGTATTLGTLAERALPGTGSGGAADPELSPAMLDALVTLLQSMPATEVARRYGIDEGRARLLAAGAMVLLAAMERLGVGALRVRRRGIREGAILAYHRWGEGWPEAAAEGRGW